VFPNVAEGGRMLPRVAEGGRGWPRVAECGRVDAGCRMPDAGLCSFQIQPIVHPKIDEDVPAMFRIHPGTPRKVRVQPG
jgi:hypothetical protein